MNSDDGPLGFECLIVQGAGGSSNGNGTSGGHEDEDMALLNPSLLAKKPPGEQQSILPAQAVGLVLSELG
jgi:hypothetical protein